jgi:uncharacterized Zn finger protein
MKEITIDDFQCPQCEADMKTVYKEDKFFHCGSCGNVYTLARYDNKDFDVSFSIIPKLPSFEDIIKSMKIEDIISKKQRLELHLFYNELKKLGNFTQS